MIAHLNGILLKKSTESAVVDVRGVGYELSIPLSTYTGLPEVNETVNLNVHTHLKDDSIKLYGFLTIKEKELFRLLIGVSGIGPRLARNILSGIEVDEFVSSISRGDRLRLSAIPGVGKKATERMILELKDKVMALSAAHVPGACEPGPVSGVIDDVLSALNNLGYRPVQSEEAVRKARARLELDVGFDELFKDALKSLSKR